MPQLTMMGLQLCLALLTGQPTYDACSLALSTMRPPPDFALVSPSQSVSNLPKDAREAMERQGWTCVEFATFQRNDGQTGSEYFCTHAATIQWIPGTPLWRWRLDEAPKETP